MQPELAGKRLYIADLACRLLAMECGQAPMQARTYRVLARQLRQAAAGLPEPALRRTFAAMGAASAALLDEVLQVRHFDQHGWLRGTQAAGAAPCQMVWLGLLARLLLPRR